MSYGRLGAFAHFLLKENEFRSLDKFDAARVVRELVEMKVDYFFLTLGQNTGFFCSPNEAYERTIGVPANSRCSSRDIPLELLPLLEGAGVDFGLYLPCQAPFHHDGAPESAFGFGATVDKWGNREINLVAAQKWSKVIEGWSLRYGSHVKAWWFDGAYEKCRFSPEIAEQYSNAARKGNPNAHVAFNFDVGVRAYMPLGVEDYTAGEINDPLEISLRGRYFDGRRLHILTFLGETWADSRPRYPTEKWIEWACPLVDSGACLSLDIAITKPDGIFDPVEKEQITKISDAIRFSRSAKES